MPRPSLSEIISERIISVEASIVPTADEPVRAIDVVGQVAAVYRFSIDPVGNWFATALLAFHQPDGSRHEAGGGGVHGNERCTPWRPQPRGPDEASLMVLGSVGTDRPDAEGQVVSTRPCTASLQQ